MLTLPRMDLLARVRASFTETPRTLGLVWRSRPGLSVALAVLTVISATLPIAVAWVGKSIVDAVLAQDSARAMTQVALELGLVATTSLVMRALGLIWQLVGNALGIDINVAILEKARTLELAQFEDPEFYDQLTRARREASTRPLAVVRDTAQLVQNALTLTGYVGLLTGFSWLAVLGMVLAGIPATLVEMRFSKAAFSLRNWRSPDTRKLNYLEYVLVGHNGAGKTTFIKLLTGLYQPSEGRILLDGVDLADMDRATLHARIGVIFQDFNQYQLAVRENVGFGSVGAMADEPRVRRAVENGGATADVAGLKAGLDTMLGRWFSREGSELSGGQWQRVALSRAFMREEADILVLDEPTAALDAESEQAVFERFRRLAKGRTTLVISHRFPTVRMADRILVIEAGALLEEGTHAELLARGGRYAHLFQLQAQGYV